MNIKNLIFAAITFTAFAAQAQKPDSLRARVSYSFKHLDDTTDREHPYTENMVLLVGRNASLYTSMDKITSYQQTIKKLQELMKTNAPGQSLKITGGGKKVSGTDYFQFANEKKLVVKQKLVNDYLLEEALPVIDWKIATDTLSIAGFKCQKATAKFKGRNYTAWFCPDLPFQSGPWKLNGLPGLIIEAYDTNREVEFKFSGFELVKNATEIPVKESSVVNMGSGTVVINGSDPGDVLLSPVIAFPKTAIKTTQKEFDKLKEAMQKDPSGFINSSMAGSGVTMRVANTASPGSNPIKAKVVNNPIELPE